ncbi:Hydrolase in cluster with beta-lactamase (HAD superfamily) [Streptococcus sp. DD11]|uniref:Cof-type HAD-IIB family hydrolase n=1 Tax=Streptococcus sp. DD11 TaxID=1777879 RepID=UPI00079373CD|nr:HAD family hydrolase [Streptococcus sp. DD11]KXT85713.1 Hydrolase in cluster with beta-lactamase (HAD superfamily) [Streptococcus sp. DD11]
MAVKLIATDMDGTLLDQNGQLDLPRLTAAVDRLEERQIRFVIATGNEMPRMRLLLGDLTERLTLVVANGARIFHKNQLIAGSFWAPELVDESLAYFAGREQELHLVVTTSQGGFVQEGTQFPLIEKVMTKDMAQLFYRRMHFLPRLQEHAFTDVLKMSMMVEETAAAEQTRRINRHFAGRLSAVTSGYGAIDILQSGVHKAWGLRQLMQRWGIQAEEIMAFGDSENDLEMLELAGISYAMANGEDKVKQAAQHMAPANSQAGVLQVLESFLEEGER